MDKVTGQCPQTTTFLKRKESRSGIEPRSFAYQPNALPLGQTGSQKGLKGFRTVEHESCLLVLSSTSVSAIESFLLQVVTMPAP